MLSRLFAFCVLVALIGGGLYYWKLEGQGLPAPESFGVVGEKLRDTTTTGAVKGAFELNRHLEPLSIRVATEDSVVTLRGDVPREELRGLAAEVAGSVPNVSQVVNHLKVSAEAREAPPSTDRSLGESLDDRALEVRLRLAFSLNRELEGTDLQVSAFRREVVLAGEVSNAAQRAAALRITEDMPGVSQVTDRVRVLGEPSGGVAAVREALRANENLARYELAVVEESGRLVLTGRVRTGAERNLAELVAREAAGRPVESRLELAAVENN